MRTNSAGTPPSIESAILVAPCSPNVFFTTMLRTLPGNNDLINRMTYGIDANYNIIRNLFSIIDNTSLYICLKSLNVHLDTCLTRSGGNGQGIRTNSVDMVSVLQVSFWGHGLPCRGIHVKEWPTSVLEVRKDVSGEKEKRKTLGSEVGIHYTADL